jgi:flagellar hook assembly protein FlgD
MKRAVLIFLFLVAATTQAQVPVLRVEYYAPSQSAVAVWSPVSGAASYQVYKANPYPSWQLVPNAPIYYSSSTGYYSTNDGVAPNAAAVYKIQPINASGAPVGPPSTPAIVTGSLYADDPLTTTIPSKVQHISDLRSAVNTMRAAAGLGAVSWARTLTVGSAVQKGDIVELRTAVDAALQNIGLASPPYLDPVLTAVPLKRNHLQQLRMRVRSFPEFVTTSPATISNQYFSPNNDGKKDSTTFSVTIQYADYYANPAFFQWGINVRNASGTVVRSVSGTGNVASFAWDGKNDLGQIQPNGVYTLELIDLDGLSGAVVSATATIDLTPPTVSISYPTNGQVLSNVSQSGGNVTVTGSATDVHFSGWTLTNPPSTNPFATGAGSSVSGSWALSAQPNGNYTIRLSATDLADNTATVDVNGTVANFTASQDVYQINAASGQHVTYTSNIPYSLTETITIKSVATGNVVRNLQVATRAAGTYTDTWDGTNDQGGPLADGLYRYFITVTNGTNSMTWDDSSSFAGSQITQQHPYVRCLNSGGNVVDCCDPSLVFDPYTNKPLKIIYSVGLQDFAGAVCAIGDTPGTVPAMPAYVSVKASAAGETSATCGSFDCIFGAFTTSPQQSEAYQSTGLHQIIWYGMGYDSAYNISGAANLTVVRHYEGWPQSQALVYGNAPQITDVAIDRVMFNPAAAGGQTFTVTIVRGTPRAVTLTAQFRNLASGSILRTVTTSASTAAQQTVSWDGKANNGDWVAPGQYEVTITATDTTGSSSSIRPLVIVKY